MKKALYFPFIALAMAACQAGETFTNLTPTLDFPAPELLSKPDHYDAMDYNTFPVYKLNYTLDNMRPQKPQDTKAIWLTKDTTYLVTAYRQHWEMMYFNMQSADFIQDNVTQEWHRPIRTIGLPTDTTFWVKGEVGQWNVFVTVYPPLPEGTTHINMGTSEALDRIPGTTGWAEPEMLGGAGLSIEELVKNQALFMKDGLAGEMKEETAVEVVEYNYMRPGRTIHGQKEEQAAETTEQQIQ